VWLRPLTTPYWDLISLLAEDQLAWVGRARYRANFEVNVKIWPLPNLQQGRWHIFSTEPRGRAWPRFVCGWLPLLLLVGWWGLMKRPLGVPVQ